MDYYKRFIEVLHALEVNKVEYILIGGFAMILHGLPRLTEDIDIFIKPDSDNIERLKKSLLYVFNDQSVNELTPSMLNDYPVIRYGSPDGFYIDILYKLGDAFKYDDLEFDIKTVEGHQIRIATAETLYNMKKDTVKAIDKEDSVFLQNILREKNLS